MYHFLMASPNSISSVLSCWLCALNKAEVLRLPKDKERMLVMIYLHTAVALSSCILTADSPISKRNFCSSSLQNFLLSGVLLLFQYVKAVGYKHLNPAVLFWKFTRIA